VLGLFTEISVAEHFVRDSFTGGACLFVAATAYFRWIAWMGVIFVASGVLITLIPSVALPVFGVATTVAIITGAVFAWRSSR
jgi:hypothetical protein